MNARPPHPHAARNRLLLALILLVSTVMASADMVPIGLRYVRITLSNGRVLKNANINGFNRDANLVYVLEDHRLRPYPVSLFPEAITDAIASRAAEYPRNPERKRPPAPAPKAPVAAPDKYDTSASAVASRQAALEAAIAEKADAAARRHLRYSIKIGSGYATVTDVDLELSAPKPVPGWSGRYRVTGSGYYSYYESVGSAFRRRTRGIEITLDASNPEQIEILDVETNWGSSWN
ncbi:hypothetical protein [Synoicihabitans lomoniglobus]|uniref:Uncharacterized protein n=1 Tax=Synoicihabitans lomoniglobus TaxID=2909285 RepID=A0AAF0CNX0_9BACT|nr:hypothetical protein [Opitutaceae bacterium LMO-M01]WED65000.1 hypothetical protein PXH66_21845 [Opitutaceae bacterium LMO-M01]